MTITTSRPTRRPAATDSITRPRLRALGAIITLLALTVGVPAALAVIVGDPLPHHFPGASQLRHDLTSPLADNTIVDVLAVVAWIAWALLVIGIAREGWTQMRGLPSPRRLPLLGINPAFVHHLVATALLLIPTAASAHAAPVAALTRATLAQPYPGAAAEAIASAPRTESPTVEAAVNSAVPTQPGPATNGAAPITTRPHKVYVVQPPEGRHYDSLWEIAARHLGDGRRYHEIYELNRGRPQPDGRELTRASLIQPGWVLALPDDATGPGVRDLSVQPVAPATGASTGDTHLPTPEHPRPVTPRRTATTTEATTQPREAQPDPTQAVTNAPSAPSTPQAPSPSVSRDGKHDDMPIAPIGIGLGVGSLAALAALQRSRRIAQRRRPLGQRPAPTPDHLKQVEAALHDAARRADPIAASVRLAVALANQRRLDTSPAAVLRYDTGRLHLVITAAEPAPSPFIDASQGWELAADATGFAFAVDDEADPLPALVELGRCGDADAYIDLEPAGYVAIDGEPSAVDDLLATVAACLVGAPWAGLTHVMIPHTLAQRVGPLEHIEDVVDLGVRSDELIRYATTVGTRVRDGGHNSIASARRAGPADADAVLTLIGWCADELPDELVRAALDPAVPLLILAPGTDPRAGQQWHLDAGLLTGTRLAEPITVAPRGTATDAVAELIEHVRETPAVDGDDPAYATVHEEAPPAAVAAELEMSVRVLGPVELHGIAMPRRTPAFQTLIYLALHRRGVTAEQLSTALWPDEIAANKTIRNRVAEARAVVGGLISDGPGWRLDEAIGSDWQLFQALAAGGHDDQLAALDLVRGQPFDGLPDEWVDLEMFRTDMVAAIIDLAASVAQRALADDRPTVAFRAARSGLRACPYEERLFRLAMQAADAEGSTGKLRALINELQRLLDVHVEPDDRMQRETIALYDELTSTARRRERISS
jgi:DNA-binding SARP family transcriptional activator